MPLGEGLLLGLLGGLLDLLGGRLGLLVLGGGRLEHLVMVMGVGPLRVLLLLW